MQRSGGISPIVYQNQSAPVMSPNQSEFLNHNITAASTNTVGSTGLNSFMIINGNSSEIQSNQNFIFPGENAQ
jgi:hypothetical protein